MGVRCTGTGSRRARRAGDVSAQQVRDMLTSGQTIHMPGIYDALTARLAEKAETAREVCAATAMPIIVDADTGYGNALSAIRTARGLFAAGASGLFLED